mgnify:CR=1 FL=1
MMRRLLVLLSLLVLAAVQPAHSAQLKLGVLPAADTIVLSCASSDQKKTTRTLFEKTLEAYKQDVARRRDEKATLIVSGL